MGEIYFQRNRASKDISKMKESLIATHLFCSFIMKVIINFKVEKYTDVNTFKSLSSLIGWSITAANIIYHVKVGSK